MVACPACGSHPCRCPTPERRYRILEERLRNNELRRIGDLQHDLEHELRQTYLPGAHPHSHHDELADMERSVSFEMTLSPGIVEVVSRQMEDRMLMHRFIIDSMQATRVDECKVWTKELGTGTLCVVTDRRIPKAWVCYSREQTWFNAQPFALTEPGEIT